MFMRVLMTRKSAKISSKTSSTLGRGLLIHLDLFARTEFNSFVTTSSVVPKFKSNAYQVLTTIGALSLVSKPLPHPCKFALTISPSSGLSTLERKMPVELALIKDEVGGSRPRVHHLFPVG